MINPKLEQWLESGDGRALILRKIRRRRPYENGPKTMWRLTLQYRSTVQSKSTDICIEEFEDTTPDEAQYRALEWIG